MSANTTTVKVKKTGLSGTSTAYKAVAVVILILLVIFCKLVGANIVRLIVMRGKKKNAEVAK